MRIPDPPPSPRTQTMSKDKIEGLIERATAAAVSVTKAADAMHTLELIDGQSRKDTPVVYLGDVVYILRAELPALLEEARREAGWIKIEEGCEMPQLGSRVLVSVDGGCVRVYDYWVRGDSDDPYYDAAWRDLSGYDCNHPAHWMPLPDPPTPEETER